MTGYRSRYFAWDCQKKGCYYEHLPSWDGLIECFPRGIRPSDADGFAEQNDHILVLEEKSHGVSLKEGQRRALRSLSRRPGITTVFFRPAIETDLECLVFGEDPALAEGWEPYDGWKGRSQSEFHAWLRKWSAHADLHPLPNYRSPSQEGR